MPLFDETVLTVRVLPDRSVADWFVQGGRWAATDGWSSPAPRKVREICLAETWLAAAGSGTPSALLGNGGRTSRGVVVVVVLVAYRIHTPAPCSPRRRSIIRCR